MEDGSRERCKCVCGWDRAEQCTFILTADLCCEFDEFQRVELVFDRVDEAEGRVISTS